MLIVPLVEKYKAWPAAGSRGASAGEFRGAEPLSQRVPGARPARQIAPVAGTVTEKPAGAATGQYRAVSIPAMVMFVAFTPILMCQSPGRNRLDDVRRISTCLTASGPMSLASE